MHEKLTIVRTCLLCASALLSTEGKSSESGQVHYPIGVSTVMNGVLPLPGQTSHYHYVQYYESDRLNDGDGRSSIPDFKAEVYAWAPRIVHTWSEGIGPFYISSGIIAPITQVTVRAFGKEETSAGMADPVISPAHLYYVNSTGTFFAFGGLDIYVPIGKYDKDRIANNGLNYWTFAPTFNFTWLPTARTEVSMTFYSEFNTRNRATNYKSGSVLTVDGDIAYRLFPGNPKIKVALQGFATKQFTDDTSSEVDIVNGNRGQAFGFGPQLSYDLAGGFGGVLVKYQKEFGAENRSEGDRLWFEVSLPF
ncbi:Protein involved in meta-pathway of phenol degradation [Pseudomonas sp. 37 R 15]|uniref:SphA family protein n=1 Tax=Pseudomonas sp. 37 R 15 TaxID=1844104 RepID=UPI0008128514|nr:transporter [Pseudomonas sp. 37 R 15]CRM38141.1 Protein involved in meta-pathway of phenol degradation [Pseudomonas sp. 37 R 15]